MPSIISALFTICLIFVRAPDIYPSRFWAEDLNVFLLQAQNEGLYSFAQTYAGYLHTVPRLAGFVAVCLPIEYAPSVFLVFVLFFSAWASTIISRTIGGCVGVIAGSALVLANGWDEPIGSVTNLQWLLAPTLLILVIKPGCIPKLEGALFALLAGLSGPFVIAFGPVYLLSLYWHYVQDKKLNVPACISVACGAMQFALVLTHPDNSYDSGSHGVATLFWTIVNLSAGRKIATYIVLPLVIVPLLIGKRKRERILLLTAILLLTLTVVAKFRNATDILSSGFVGMRYWYVQGVIWLLIAASAMRERARSLQLAGFLMAVVLVVASINRTGISRDWVNVGADWAQTVKKSFSAPIEFQYAPDWKVRIENGIITAE